MRWRAYRPLLGLALLAAGVLGYWAVSERPQQATTAESARHSELPLIPAGSLPDPRLLDEVAIELAGSTPVQFSLQRRRDGQRAGFYLTPPGNRADDAEVESLFSALLSAVAERRLSPPAVRPASAGAEGRAPAPGDFYATYGVGDEQCRVRVRFGAGHSLCFGADSPSGSVYVRVDRAPAILVVERTLFELLARPPERYRSERLVLAPLASAHAIELGALHLIHDGDLWRVQAADGSWALAEPALVEALVQRLGTWPVSSWATAQPEVPALRPVPKEVGFPRPLAATGSGPSISRERESDRDAARTATHGHSPGAAPLRLTVDGEEVLRGGWRCPRDAAPAAQLFVRSDGAAVCAESPAARRLLPRWTELRAQRPLSVPSAQVARLQLLPSIDLVRQPDGTYTQSGQPADTTSVRHVLELLTQERALGEAGSTTPPPTAVRIVATTVLGQKVTLQLWPSGAQTLVRRDQEPAELLPEPATELLALTPLSLAPRQLLAIEPAAVQRISRRGAANEVLARKSVWQLSELTVAPADSAAVEALLAALTDLRVERWVSLQPRPEYGLDPPQLRLTITTRPSGDPGSSRPDAAGKKESAESGSGRAGARVGSRRARQRAW